MIDMSIRLSILDLMLKMNKEFGIAYIFITHDLATARYFGGNDGRLAALYSGRVVEIGVCADMYKMPIHPYLTSLLMVCSIPDPRIAKKSVQLPAKWEAGPVSGRGCKFYSRCAYAKEVCSREEPPLEEYTRNHWVACHLKEAIPKWILTEEGWLLQ